MMPLDPENPETLQQCSLITCEVYLIKWPVSGHRLCNVTEGNTQRPTAALVHNAQCTELHEAKSLDRLWCWKGFFFFCQPLWGRTSPSLNYPVFLCGGEQLSRCSLSSRASLPLINETLINPPRVWRWCPWSVIMCGHTNLYIGGGEGVCESLFIIQDEACIPITSKGGVMGHFYLLWPFLRLRKGTWSRS